MLKPRVRLDNILCFRQNSLVLVITVSKQQTIETTNNNYIRFYFGKKIELSYSNLLGVRVTRFLLPFISICCYVNSPPLQSNIFHRFLKVDPHITERLSPGRGQWMCGSIFSLLLLYPSQSCSFITLRINVSISRCQRKKPQLSCKRSSSTSTTFEHIILRT